MTSSCAVHWDARLVKPSMSANRMLWTMAEDGRTVWPSETHRPPPPLPVSSPPPTLPDIVVLLNVDLMKHHVFFLCVDVFFHLHGNMLGQHRQQQPLLDQWFQQGTTIFLAPHFNPSWSLHILEPSLTSLET